MKTININEKKYVIVENLGFVQSRGCYAKVVLDGHNERIIIKVGKDWVFAKPIIQPISRMTGQSIKM